MPGFGSMFEGSFDGGGGSGLPPATQAGQVIFSVDGATFEASLPLTAPDVPGVPFGSAGWLVNDLGVLIVVG
jgi:hypothetical protein